MIIGIVVLVLVAIGLFFFTKPNNSDSDNLPTNSYSDCVKQSGSRIIETYPEQCVTSDGKTFPNPDQVLDNSSESGKFCGGIAGISCPEGYACKLDGNYPDAGGVCVAKQDKILLKACPDEWIVDAMPGIGQPNPNDPPKEYFIYQGVRRELSEFDVDWVKSNCDVKPLYAY